MFNKSTAVVSLLVTLPFLVFANTGRNHPVLAPIDDRWHQWQVFSYMDQTQDHNKVSDGPSLLCIKNIGEAATHTLYEWYGFEYGDPSQTFGRGFQEGDHFYFHGDFPELVFQPDGDSSPPSKVVFFGQTIGGSSHPQNLEKLASAFAKNLNWSSREIDTAIHNMEMSYHGKICEQPADGCDYSDAHNNNGFGFNDSTNQSCPPLESMDAS